MYAYDISVYMYLCKLGGNLGPGESVQVEAVLSAGPSLAG